MLKWQDKSRAGTAEGRANMWQVPARKVSVALPIVTQKVSGGKAFFASFIFPFGCLMLLIGRIFFWKKSEIDTQPASIIAHVY